MSQGFNPNIPQMGDLLDPNPIRTNFNALFTTNSGSSAPLSATEGTLWLDTSTPGNTKLKIFCSGAWRTLFEYVNSTPLTKNTSVNTVVFKQDDASTEWQFTHNLNKYPSITVVNEAGEVIEPNKKIYIDANKVRVEFSTPQKGKLYLN